MKLSSEITVILGLLSIPFAGLLIVKSLNSMDASPENLSLDRWTISEIGKYTLGSQLDVSYRTDPSTPKLTASRTALQANRFSCCVGGR